MSSRTAAADRERVPTPRVAAGAGALTGIVLIGANLRAALTGVGSLLPGIEHSTGLSGAWGGLLGALPLLTFAATSPLVGRISHRYGTPRVLGGSLLLLIVGLLVRSLPGAVFLFGGTVIVSAAIAGGNVLLPAVVKGAFPPARVSQVTGLYVTAMGLVAAVSSGVSVPLAEALPGGWHTALGCWALLAAAALLVWLPQQGRLNTMSSSARARARSPWRSWLAWQVSVFMGLQSLCFYSIIAWLPSIVHDHGTGESAAGWLLFVFQLAGLLSSSALPVLTRRWTNQRSLAAAASTLCALGFALLAADPGLALVAGVLLGLGGGACLVLALTFQGQRAADEPQAAALAAMAQSIGYLVAAAGPLLLGVLHDLTGTWTTPLLVLVALALLQAAVGTGAGRDLTILPTGKEQPS
ncbi:MFS transporter [Streptomyces sp. NPDC056178]|uniref:MFS transporter n=1 Tax=Streptomyces sp. NPDC056178 TaxID=3345735 RepID=UPI0035E2F4EF